MGRELVIFASTDRADPLVNVISYCVANRSVGRVRLCKVVDGLEQGDNSNTAIKLAADIERQFDSLSQGKYCNQDGKSKDLPSLPEKDRAFYETIWKTTLQRNLNPQNLSSAGAIELVRGIQGAADGPIIDITTVKNRLLVDITLLSAAHNIKDLCSFEIDDSVAMTYDEQVLLHALPQSAIHYRNLLAEETAKESLRMLRRWTVSGRFLAIGITVTLVVISAALFFEGIKSTITTMATITGISLSALNLILGLRKDRALQ